MEAIPVRKRRQRNGCSFVSPRKDLEEHEKGCKSRPVLCPDGNCDEMIPLNKLEQHLHLTREQLCPCRSNTSLFTYRKIRPYSTHKLKFWMKCSIGRDDLMQMLHASWEVIICKYATTTFLLKFDMVDGLFYTWLYVVAGEGEKFTKMFSCCL
jgi:hypothetical protein